MVTCLGRERRQIDGRSSGLHSATRRPSWHSRLLRRKLRRINQNHQSQTSHRVLDRNRSQSPRVLAMLDQSRSSTGMRARSSKTTPRIRQRRLRCRRIGRLFRSVRCRDMCRRRHRVKGSPLCLELSHPLRRRSRRRQVRLCRSMRIQRRTRMPTYLTALNTVRIRFIHLRRACIIRAIMRQLLILRRERNPRGRRMQIFRRSSTRRLTPV